MVMEIYVYTFIAIFLLNIIPIFGPPTAVVLAFISFSYSIPSIPLFVLVALSASTLGRILLTSFSKNLIRNKFLPLKYRKNMDYLKSHLDRRPHYASFLFFIEGFTPLPSDQFFIAYGLTGMKLRYAIVPFILARIFTYSFFVITATDLSKLILTKSLTTLSFLTWPFIIGELVILVLLYYFVKIDWKHLIMHKRVKVINHNHN